MQFGFKEKVGTNHCSLFVKSIARHYIKKGSRVYAAQLDATKAFDGANFYKIFKRLMLKGIPKSVVRLLLAWYESTNIKTSWQSNLSTNAFSISHSTRQGGLLSPILFSIGIMDDLLSELELSQIGCRINNRYVGGIAYADDITLLSPTVTGLNKMLEICSDWSKRNQITFNPLKSFAICFADNKNKWPKNKPIPVHMNGQLLPTVKEILHLGHLITETLDDSVELLRIAKSFNKQFHAFFCPFNTVRNTELLKEVLTSFCFSFYGIESLNPQMVTASSIKFFKKSFNLALMKLLRLPPESISPFLVAEGILNADAIWKVRRLSFWKSVVTSNHSYKSVLIDNQRTMIINSMTQLNLLPYSLSSISVASIKNCVLKNWMEEKDLV